MKKKYIALISFVVLIIVIGLVCFMILRSPQKLTIPEAQCADMEMPPFDRSLDIMDKGTLEDESLFSSENPIETDKDSKDDITNNQSQISKNPSEKLSHIAAFKGVWISYMDIKNLTYNKDESSFMQAFKEACSFAKKININTLIVQVRPFSDAIYKSEIFPWSHILTGTQGKDPGYDPLEIILRCAKEQDLAVHGWINPYRIKTNDMELAKSNPAQNFLNSTETKSAIVQCGGGLYYNMAEPAVIDLITAGVKELVQNYEIDGIHFDDYFYPTADASFDLTQFQKYQENGGKDELVNWRRENVSKLIANCYKAIKATNKNVAFGISPSGDIKKASQEMFADVEKWISNDGYIDYICPQIYYGYTNQTLPFTQTLEQWKKICDGKNVKLVIGLPFYKSGNEDKWAGSGAKEFTLSSQIITNMIKQVSNDKAINGYVLYDFNHLKNTNAVSMQELQQIIDLEPPA